MAALVLLVGTGLVWSLRLLQKFLAIIHPFWYLTLYFWVGAGGKYIRHNIARIPGMFSNVSSVSLHAVWRVIAVVKRVYFFWCCFVAGLMYC